MRHNDGCAVARRQRIERADHGSKPPVENVDECRKPQCEARVDHVLACRAEMHMALVRGTDRLAQLRDQFRDHDAVPRRPGGKRGHVGTEPVERGGDRRRGLVWNDARRRFGARQRGLETQHRPQLIGRKQRCGLLVAEEAGQKRVVEWRDVQRPAQISKKMVSFPPWRWMSNL